MSVSLTHCNFCNARLGRGSIPMFCSTTCKNSKEEEQRQKRLGSAKTHSPWDRMTSEEQQTVRNNTGTKGPVRWTKAVFEASGENQWAEESEDIPDDFGIGKPK